MNNNSNIVVIIDGTIVDGTIVDIVDGTIVDIYIYNWYGTIDWTSIILHLDGRCNNIMPYSRWIVVDGTIDYCWYISLIWNYCWLMMLFDDRWN